MRCPLCKRDDSDTQKLALQYARGTLAGKDEEINRLKQLLRARPDEDETLQENARLKSELARANFALNAERERNARLTSANQSHEKRQRQLEGLRKGRATAKANAKKRRAEKRAAEREAKRGGPTFGEMPI